jgi:hypothetical protein
MKVEDLEEGKFYGCLLTNRPILIVKAEEDTKTVTVGLMGVSYVLESGERQIGYNRVTLYDGQMVELDNQPELKQNKTK